MFENWRADPSILAGLAAVALGYTYCVGPLRARRPATRPITPLQLVSFAGALLSLWLALESPVDAWGDESLFFAHMTQHLILVLVTPVLALAGTPSWLLSAVTWPCLVARAARFLTRPLVALLTFNVIFAGAHLPPIFDYVGAHEIVHAAEHLVFLATGILTWWPIIAPMDDYRALADPMKMGYLFVQTLPCSIVAALITLAGSALYEPYLTAPRITALSALQDQQVGGLIMWIGGTTYFFAAMTIIFFHWAYAEEAKALGKPVPSQGVSTQPSATPISR